MNYINTTKDYWISATALYIELNALGNPDYIQANCVSGAQILVYVKDIIGYDAGHNYRRWSLQAAPTVFNSHTAKYVYAAIPRHDDNKPALIVFPSEKIDIYGYNAGGTMLGSEDYYYIFLQGIISSSGDNGTTPREWQSRIQTGFLSSDEAINARDSDSEWYQYSAVDQIATFIKDVTMKVGTKFLQLYAKAITVVTGGSISFEDGGLVEKVADFGSLSDQSSKEIVTPEYLHSREAEVEKKYLRKDQDDKTEFGLEMAKAKVNGRVDIFGNLVVKDLTHLDGGADFGLFNKGIEGGHVDFYGNAEFESVIARTFLETPELRKKRTTVTVGNEWQTVGAGIIEQVWPSSVFEGSAYEGIAKLKLEPGEPGAIAFNDLCQGIFNFGDGTDSPTTTDTHDGNFQMQGFTTVYFRIVEIYTADTLPPAILAELGDEETVGDNQFFRYELRAATCASLPIEDRNRWTDTHHPVLGMHFAAYANPTNAERQACRLKTTTYVIHLTGMTNWTYNQNNIQLIYGWLDGFTLLRQVWDKDKKEFVEAPKELHGEGIATGNLYMWGNIDQFDRAPSLISQQLYFKSTVEKTSPDPITVNDTHTIYQLNGWRKDSILPSATDRYVWQQWLYTYSDGTYEVSEVSLYTIDSTALTVVVDKPIISVAISDFYDQSNPDDIDFDLVARLASGEDFLPVSAVNATYNAPAAVLTYNVEYNEDKTLAFIHINIRGFIGTQIDGTTPEDNFVTITLTTETKSSAAVGNVQISASATVTLAQNREGDDGVDGTDGDTPYIGENGNWWIGGEDTGNPSQGEQGERGNDGAGITIKGTALRYFETYGEYDGAEKESGLYLVFGRLDPMSIRPQSLLGAYLYTYDAESDTTEITDAEESDCYVVAENGHLFSATRVGESQIGRGNNLVWTDCGNITGKDAITLNIEGEQVIFPDKGTAQYVYIDVYRGSTRLSPSEYTYSPLSATLYVLDDKVTWASVTRNGSKGYRLQPKVGFEGTDISGTIPYTVTVDGVEYRRTINIRTILNGTNGYNGCLIRRSEWQEGKTYRNDSNFDSVDPVTGQYIIDQVIVSDYNSGLGYAYLCQQTHTATKSNKPRENVSVDANWRKLDNSNPFRTSFADIDQALVNYLQARQLVITDDEDHPYGAFGGGKNNNWPLWFGGIDWLNSVFRVNRLGQLFSKKLVAFGQQTADGTPNGPRVEIENGIASFFGNQSHPNIALGIDTNGCAVLKFYDQYNHFLYDLGPDGLQYAKVQELSFVLHRAAVLNQGFPTSDPAQVERQFDVFVQSHYNDIRDLDVGILYQVYMQISAGAYTAQSARTVEVPFVYDDGSGNGTRPMVIGSNMTMAQSADMDKCFLSGNIVDDYHRISGQLIVGEWRTYQGKVPDDYLQHLRAYPDYLDEYFATGVRYRQVHVVLAGHSYLSTNIYFE